MLANGSVDEEPECSELDKAELVIQREDLSEDHTGWSKAHVCDRYYNCLPKTCGVVQQ